HLAVLRSVTSKEADHEQAYHLLHTGNSRSETVAYPTLGSVVAREWSGAEGDLPPFVALGGGSAGPGFFGVEFAPYVVADPNAPISNVTLPEGVDEVRRRRQLEALAALNRGFARRVDRTSVAQQERFTARALRLQRSPALKAFDLSAEKPAVREAYGLPSPPKEGEAAQEDAGAFARSCLTARRLVEHGVRFVEVALDGWDTHADNFNAVMALSKQLDTGFAALVADLAGRGLLEQTLVVCMGEFGRTPTINAANGRDHWSEVFSVVLAGGGVRGGQVIGASDAKGEQPKQRPVTVPDLYATLLSAFGVSGRKQFRMPDGRP